MANGMQISAKNSTTNKEEDVLSTDNSMHSFKSAQDAEERNPGTANQYGVGVDECDGSILDASTSAQAVSGGNPALIFGIQINTALAGTLTITGLTNVSGTDTDIVLPIATPIGYYEMKGAKCDTALVCTLSDATDDVLVLWRAQ